MSIFVFYKISTWSSILQFLHKILIHFLQVLSRLTSDSTTFKVAVSHFVLYPCGPCDNHVCYNTFFFKVSKQYCRIGPDAGKTNSISTGHHGRCNLRILISENVIIPRKLRRQFRETLQKTDWPIAHLHDI